MFSFARLTAEGAEACGSQAFSEQLYSLFSESHSRMLKQLGHKDEVSCQSGDKPRATPPLDTDDAASMASLHPEAEDGRLRTSREKGLLHVTRTEAYFTDTYFVSAGVDEGGRGFRFSPPFPPF